MSDELTAQAAQEMPLAEIDRLNARYRNSFISVSALAEQLGTSTRTLRRRQAAGQMPRMKWNGHKRGYDSDEIEAWLPTSGFSRVDSKG